MAPSVVITEAPAEVVVQADHILESHHEHLLMARILWLFTEDGRRELLAGHFGRECTEGRFWSDFGAGTRELAETGRAGTGALGQGSPAVTSEATAEARTITTMRADQLQPGDVIRLFRGTDCTVANVSPQEDNRCLVFVRYGLTLNSSSMMGVWLWKYSRVEVLSAVSGRGHLVTPMTSAMTSESMEEPQGESATAAA